MDNQNDLALLLDVARARRDDWLLRQARAQRDGDQAIVKQAHQAIADCDEKIGELQRASS